ncbi:MAG: hypothetical protein HGA38_03050 [Candidatus Moranbacteria bacterium]|nr:hypothetical protein [Candidatus Moranbacteria bacterium]
MKKILTIFIVLLAVFALVDTVIWHFSRSNERAATDSESLTPTSDVPSSESEPAADTPPPTQTTGSVLEPATGTEPKTKQVVPFVVQAPEGKWGDPVFQDGCEEASMFMTSLWITGQPAPSAESAASAIRSAAEYETERFGYAADLSLSDVVATLSGYFRVDTTETIHGITLSDMRNLAKEPGTVILVPVYGRALGNPFFTPPGPITHMLVVTDYDDETKRFVVNDPGTRHGEGYRYDEAVLFRAIWNYPSGKTHPTPPTSDERARSVIAVHHP